MLTPGSAHFLLTGFVVYFLFSRHFALSVLSWRLDVFRGLPVRLPFTTFPCCLYLVQILDTADCEQPTSFATFRDYLPSLRRLKPWYMSVHLVDQPSKVWAALLFNCRLTSRFNLIQVLVLEMEIYTVIPYSFLRIEWFHNLLPLPDLKK